MQSMNQNKQKCDECREELVDVEMRDVGVIKVVPMTISELETGKITSGLHEVKLYQCPICKEIKII